MVLREMENESSVTNSKKNMEALRKKHLKDVIYKNKYFPDECLGRKSQLIKEILREERKRLKIVGDIESEDENVIADRQCENILKEKKINLFYDYNKIERKKTKKEEIVQGLPKINKNNMNKFLSQLRNDKKISSREKSLKLCLDHMHSSVKPFWTSPSSIMKAINHCLLTRNWNNLTHLILFLINLPSDRYKPLIRHLCQIVDKRHPVVQENNIQGQLTLVHQANRGPNKGSTTVIEPE